MEDSAVFTPEQNEKFLASHAVKDDDSKSESNKSIQRKSQRKLPSFTKQIHIAGVPNSFTYKLRDGKNKFDQSLQRCCVRHRCVGVFEVKIDLKSYGLKHNNIKKIEYDATNEG